MGLDQRITVLTTNQDNTLSSNEYWLRKVNSLQGYFENKYQTQNVVEHRFDLEDVQELIELTQKILEHPNDTDYINSVLPPTSGFFYGSTEIDEYFFEDMKDINEIMTEIKNTPNINRLLYWCWY